jgi:hypothetical protein
VRGTILLDRERGGAMREDEDEGKSKGGFVHPPEGEQEESVESEETLSPDEMDPDA